MTEIIEFLTKRYDEKEAAARAADRADPAPWTAEATDKGDTRERSGHGFGGVIAADDVALWDTEGSRTLCMTAPTSRHVAMHDPARVLAEVAAKRKRLALHKPGPVGKYGDPVPRCLVCLSDRAGRLSDDWQADVYPCATILLDAAVYADHIDYQQKWSVDD
jgi:hypothetical protein